MSHKRQQLGKAGEDLAARYLQKNGYAIIHRNYRCRSGEIDIIASHQATLVFIEVKTRSTNRFGTPAEAVTRRKQQQISRVAEEYLAQNGLFTSPARFDVLSIVNDGSQSHITHITDAFELC